MTPYLLIAGTALLVSLLAVPPTIRMARALNLLDSPDAVRRLHHLAVPRLGGLAVWVGVVVGLLVAVAVPLLLPGVDLFELSGAQQRLALGLVAGAALMIVVGLVDDVRGLAPSQKLVAQAMAATLVVTAGFRIDVIALPGLASLALGWLAVPVTLLWIIGVTNAFNLIDGLDGLAGGVALVGLACVGIAGALLGNSLALTLAMPLAGGVIGFLRYNTARPSRIFLGDVGSLSIGFVLAVLTIESARRPTGEVLAVVPLFALAFPLLDTAIAMLRRWLRGVPLSGADGRHVHHQLVCLGLSRSRAAAAICAFSAVHATLGLSLAFAPASLTLTLALLAGGAGILFVVHGLRWLGYHEFIEAQASFASGLFKARGVIRDRILAREFELHIRAADSFATLEATLQHVQTTFCFERVLLTNVSSPEPPEEQSSFVGGRLMRLDCPIESPDRRSDAGFVLHVWWRSDARTPPLYGERIVRILAPAIEAALATCVLRGDVRSRALTLDDSAGVAPAPTAAAALPRSRRARDLVRRR